MRHDADSIVFVLSDPNYNDLIKKNLLSVKYQKLEKYSNLCEIDTFLNFPKLWLKSID